MRIRYKSAHSELQDGIGLSPTEDLTIKQAQETVKTFLETKNKDWTLVDNRFYLFTHMSEEMGELARHLINAELNLSTDRTAIEPVAREGDLSLIRDDLGDLLYHILKLAIAYNIDLAEAFKESLSSIEKRYGRK